MNLLLDTHAFVWWRDSPEKLSSAAFDAISEPENDIYLSVVSVWEIEIKRSLGKVQLNKSLDDSIEAERTANGLKILTLELPHVYTLRSLNYTAKHKDPFDRILISQALTEELTIVTTDRHFMAYNVPLLW